LNDREKTKPIELSNQETIMIENLSNQRRVLTLFDCVCIIVGTIIGAGIFKMPAVVASNAPSLGWLIFVWVFGGMIALIGALCFAELTTTYPDQGGDYGYLKRAYHPRIAFAFSWAAFWVIRPGNIGAMAMIFGKFADEAFPGLIPITPDSTLNSVVVFAAGVILLMTATNLIGITFGKTTQNVLTVAKVIGILLIVVGAFLWTPVTSSNDGVPESSPTQTLSDLSDLNKVSFLLEQDEQIESALDDTTSNSGVSSTASNTNPSGEADEQSDSSWFWLSMVFVMFTFGGWNDIAFVATEARDPKRNLLRALVLGTLTVLVVYLLVNFALVYGLGFERMADLGSRWENATSVLVKQNLGDRGGTLFSILVCVSCLGAINAMIFTSPRIYTATARDYPQLGWLAGGSEGRGWWRAMVLQAVVTLLAVIVFGSQESGFENLVAANAPYFWLFLALTVIGLIVLRIRTKGKFDGYRVPLYPLLPLFFTACCGFMIYRGLLYMVEQELQIPALVIGGWVLFGFVLSMVLKQRVAE
jgi:amino acid transporter